ncbi:MAG: 30S ribosomal protein S4 [Firmicutes bacterium HGW-Firmicutes-13]|nr:MAG: 30S ribosomal protein S4 [Firmicutes bacterium HGW-Firmicutes-13]
MGRYKESVCRLCRREGLKLFLKGERCYTDKCAIDRRAYAPGQHGKSRRKVSEFGVQLREKQKARRFYGVMEKQFRNYFRKAEQKKGITGENLLQILESRLDNVVYRLGFAGSRSEARQLITHGHFRVNGIKVNIPSYLTKPGDEISVREKSRTMPRFKEFWETAAQRALRDWLELDIDNWKGRVTRIPSRDEIDVPVSEHLIVELYSR